MQICVLDFPCGYSYRRSRQHRRQGDCQLRMRVWSNAGTVQMDTRDKFQRACELESDEKKIFLIFQGVSREV